jgi:hypothetical protein
MLKDVIQEKINKMKEIDQNISISLFNNSHAQQQSNGNSMHTSQPPSGVYSHFQ